MILRLLLVWLINSVALVAVAYLMPSIQVSSFGAALVAALVLGLVNAVVRPVLVLLEDRAQRDGHRLVLHVVGIDVGGEDIGEADRHHLREDRQHERIHATLPAWTGSSSGSPW